MEKREERVINSFINLVKVGEISYDWAVSQLEKTDSYGYLTEKTKEKFYTECEAYKPIQAEPLEPMQEETLA